MSPLSVHIYTYIHVHTHMYVFVYTHMYTYIAICYIERHICVCYICLHVYNVLYHTVKGPTFCNIHRNSGIIDFTGQTEGYRSFGGSYRYDERHGLGPSKGAHVHCCDGKSCRDSPRPHLAMAPWALVRRGSYRCSRRVQLSLNEE